jgi:hypothetical protein
MMMSRGARAERQATLRLLESVQMETDQKRQHLEDKHTAMPILSAQQADEVVSRILAMSPEAVVEFFQNSRLRMAGKNPFTYIYGDPRETPHKDDPEVAAAVERVNLAICAHDDAALDLRIVELFGGRISWEESRAPRDESIPLDRGVFALDIFAVMVSVAKTDAFYRSLEGHDIRVLERENLYQLKRDWPSFVCLPSETDDER